MASYRRILRAIGVGVYLLVTLAVQPLHGQSAAVFPVPITQWFDASGDPLNAGTLTFYQAGTTTPLDAYSDVSLSTPVANPYTLTSAGRTSVPIYLSAANSYKIILKDSAGSTIWTADNISGGVYLARQAMAPQVVTTTATGTQNDLSLASCATSAPCVLRANNATDLTINGFSALTTGQRLTVVSVGAGNVYLAHQNSSSTATGRLINLATSSSTPLAAGSGIADYVYDGTTQRFRLVSHEQGAWITPTFAGGDYTAATGNWSVDSGDVTECRYWLRGRALLIDLAVSTTDVSATPATLRRAVPNGYTIVSGADTLVRVSDAGASSVVGLARPAVTTIQFFSTVAGAAWSLTSSDNTTVNGYMTFEVQ